MVDRTTVMMVLALVCFACDADDGEADATDGASEGAETTGAMALDEDDIVQRATAYADTLVRVSAEPRGSQHGLASTVHVWVDPDVADLYRALDPDAVDEPAVFPGGALLVKEHLDDAGMPAGLTVMAQGDPDPSSGGWWWGRIDAEGELRDKGQVAFCIDCHRAVQSEGWVYGVALDNRAP